MSIVANHPIEEVRGSAERAWRWWLGELGAVWAVTAQRWRTWRGSQITIEAGEEQWLIRRGNRASSAIECSNGAPLGLTDVAARAGGRTRVFVEIPPERVLSKTIALPADAEHRLSLILGFEISRHFPFAAERVFYGHRVVSRAQGTGPGPATVSVEIAAVPREVVFAIADALAAAGLTAASFSLTPAVDAKPLALATDPLLPVAAIRRVPRALLLTLCGFAAAAAVSWPLAQQVRLAEIDRDIAALKPAADTTLQLRSQQQHATDQEATVAALRNGRATLVNVLNDLTRTVPDGSWLISLSIKGRDIVLDGLSPSAATIALALQRNPAFAEISFRSPIARDPATGLEHFQLGASLAEAAR
ncbi:MAG: PilN domain-containing protein [Alphaproteobacteria bacterium]|nr:PilN domain-containing protein [Alphaproteobacteria bacterium]